MLTGRSCGSTGAMSRPPSRMRPSSGVSKAGEHPQQRGLAAAARAQQRKELARPDVEREPVQPARKAPKFLETPSMRSNGASPLRRRVPPMRR